MLNLTLKKYLHQNGNVKREVVLGSIFQAALASGLKIYVHPFTDGEYINIGTIRELNITIHRFSA